MNIRPYSVGLLPNREVKVIDEYSTDVLRVLCSEHMGKTNLTILAAVADRPSVWPPQPTASNYILLAVEIKCPFCHEVPQEWRNFHCGHPVCSTCAEVLNSRRRPIDRVCHAHSIFPRWDGIIYWLILLTKNYISMTIKKNKVGNHLSSLVLSFCHALIDVRQLFVLVEVISNELIRFNFCRVSG